MTYTIAQDPAGRCQIPLALPNHHRLTAKKNNKATPRDALDTGCDDGAPRSVPGTFGNEVKFADDDFSMVCVKRRSANREPQVQACVFVSRLRDPISGERP